MAGTDVPVSLQHLAPGLRRAGLCGRFIHPAKRNAIERQHACSDLNALWRSHIRLFTALPARSALAQSQSQRARHDLNTSSCLAAASFALAQHAGTRRHPRRRAAAHDDAWGAAPKSGQIVYTKFPCSACMNSFRIE